MKSFLHHLISVSCPFIPVSCPFNRSFDWICLRPPLPEFAFSSFGKEAEERKWLIFDEQPSGGRSSGGSSGGAYADVCFFFTVACALLPVFGLATSRDCIHSYLIILLWLVGHHYCYSAVRTDGQTYLGTLLLPSTCLMPLEYCLPIVGFGEFAEIKDWRDHLYDNKDIELFIHA